jgi:phosphoribosylaminoimidazole-succinocarboxamide synthase
MRISPRHKVCTVPLSPFSSYQLSCHKAAKLIGEDLYGQISHAALDLYNTAASYAHARGVILADTKFEFGLVPHAAANTSSTSDPVSSEPQQKLILIDELLTPDSSRYWPLASYAPGGPQPSFDKQYLRDWLVDAGFQKGLEDGPEGKEGEGWVIEENVVIGTKNRYEEAVRLLVGRGLDG